MTATRPKRWTRFWPLLYPGAYLLHLAEEVWGGGGFVAWLSLHMFPEFDEARFLLINAVAWPSMLVASLAVIYVAGARWVAVSLSVILLINGMLHLGSSLATGSYSPGVLTGTLLYLPLSLLSLRCVLPEVPRGRRVVAVGVGVAVHAMVMLLAAGIGRA